MVGNVWERVDDCILTNCYGKLAPDVKENIVGRAEVLGRPMQYGTTKKFLEVFGLNSLKDLPNVEELKNPQS